MFYFDSYYFILILPAMLIAMWAQTKVTSTFNRYKTIGSMRGMTAAQVARSILDQNGLSNIEVTRVGGNLTDHYDPRTDIISLSDSVYGSTSIASIGVAAHEVGHAVQYAQGYAPIKVRNAIVPVANIGSFASFPLILLGMFMSIPDLITIGILAFSLATVFQLITLPVELNASHRALETLSANEYLTPDEIGGAKQVLDAAALTYIAALIVSAAQLLRLVLLFGGRSRRR